jgi:hypothetical protein
VGTRNMCVSVVADVVREGAGVCLSVCMYTPRASATSLPLGTDTRTRHCPGGPSLPPFSGAGLQPLLQLMPGWGTLFPVSFPGPAVPGWASYPIPRTQSLGLPDPHQLPSLLHLLVDTLTRTAPGRPHRPPSYLGWNLACAWSASSRTVCGCLCTCGAGYARCDCACTCGGVGPLFPKPPPTSTHGPPVPAPAIVVADAEVSDGRRFRCPFMGCPALCVL